MSNNAAVAAAQRRRAGPQNPPATHSGNQKLDGKGPSMPRSLGLSDVLAMQSRQLRFLKDYQESNERHWEANDDFLQQLSEKVDELTEADSPKPDGSSGNGLSDTVSKLSAELALLRQAVAGLQDEVIQLQS